MSLDLIIIVYAIIIISLKVEVTMNIRKINSHELMEARNISSLCFNWEHDTKDLTPEEYFTKEVEGEETADSLFWANTWAAFTDENEMMANLSVPEFEVEFDGDFYQMGGIGGVCTYPQYRRHGAIREIFQQALPDLYGRGFTFSYLYAFSEAFYRNFGYEPACHMKGWTFQMETLPKYQYDGTFTLYRGEEDISGFQEAYEKFAVQYNMCVLRKAYHWGKVKQAHPFKGSNAAYLYRDHAGKAVGYLVLTKVEEEDKTILHCSEVVFDSFTTLKALCSFAKTFQADYEFFRLRVPNHIDLRYFCTDYSQSDSKIEEFQNGMVRVVNVHKALKGAVYNGSGKLKIRITDPIIKENEKDIEIEFKNNKCKHIIETESKVENIVDISMTINQFSVAIIGRYDISDFAYIGLEIPREKQELIRKVFYKKPCFIIDFF